MESVNVSIDLTKDSQELQEDSEQSPEASAQPKTSQTNQAARTPKGEKSKILNYFKPAMQPANAKVARVGGLEDELMDNTHDSDLIDSMIDVESMPQSTPNGEKRKKMEHPASSENTPTKQLEKRQKAPSERIIDAGRSARRRLSKGNENQKTTDMDEDVDDPQSLDINLSQILGNSDSPQTLQPLIPIHAQRYITQEELIQKANDLDENMVKHQASIDYVLSTVIDLQRSQEKVQDLSDEHFKKIKAEQAKGVAAINEISAVLINIQKDTNTNSSAIQQNEVWIKENRDFLNGLRARMEEDSANNAKMNENMLAYGREISGITSNINQAKVEQQTRNNNTQNVIKTITEDIARLKEDQEMVKSNTALAYSNMTDHGKLLEEKMEELNQEKDAIRDEIKQISNRVTNMANSERSNNTTTTLFSQDLHQIKRARANEVQKTIFILYNETMNVNNRSNTHSIFEAIQKGTTLNIDTPAAISPRQSGAVFKYNNQGQASQNIAKIKSGSKNAIACFAPVLPEDAGTSKEMKNRIRNDFNTTESKLQIRHTYHYSKPETTLFPSTNNGVSLIYILIDKENSRKKIFTAELGIDEEPSLKEISEDFLKLYPREGETLNNGWISFPKGRRGSNEEQASATTETANQNTPVTNPQQEGTGSIPRTDAGNTQGKQNTQVRQANQQGGGKNANKKATKNKNDGMKKGGMDRHILRGNFIPRY